MTGEKRVTFTFTEEEQVVLKNFHELVTDSEVADEVTNLWELLEQIAMHENYYDNDSDETIHLKYTQKSMF